MTSLLPQTIHTDAIRIRRTWPKQVVAVLRESRPGVQLVFFLRAATSSELLWHPSVRSAIFVLGWLCITVAIYVFNGVTDLAADGANGSARPIATRQLSIVSAVYASVALSGLGLLACSFVNFDVTVIAAGMLVLGWSYSAGPAFKNAPMGFAIVIGVGAALTYVGGWVARGEFEPQALVISLFISLWVGACCASKDFSDIEGDRLAGRRTWPVLAGPRRTAVWLTVLAIATSTGLGVISIQTSAPISPALVLGIGSLLLASAANRFCTAPTRSRRRVPYKVFMATQYSVNLATMIVVS